jgi:glycosyltransferase involved in cell wall biosynthesis
VRLTLVIASLGSGGAERVLSIMANWWVGRDVAVALVTLADAGADFYPLDPRVRRVGLGATGDSRNLAEALRNNVARIRALRRAILDSRPDAVISFVDTVNVVALLATARLHIPVIVSERIDPRRHPIGRGWSVLRRLTYPRAAAVVAQSADVARWIHRNLRPQRCVVIPNPAPARQRTSAAGSRTATPDRDAGHAPTIIAMGRCVPQKGFDILLDAFARVAARHADWRLSIVGDGPDRGALQALAARLSIADRVEFPGRVTDPARLMGNAEMFVLSSRYEGFPNALLEAMACGLACVSFDCPSGPADIVRNGVDGVLVPREDATALARTLDRLMGSSAERRRLAARAPEVTERFGVDSVMGAWNDLIATVRGVEPVDAGAADPGPRPPATR